MMTKVCKGPQHILDALSSEVGQLVHKLPLQDLEQHWPWMMIEGSKGPESVAHVLTVEMRQPLHGLCCHCTQELSA